VFLLGLDESLLSIATALPEQSTVFEKRYGSILGRLFEVLVWLDLMYMQRQRCQTILSGHTHKSDHEIDFIVQKGGALWRSRSSSPPSPTLAVAQRAVRRSAGRCGIITTGAIAYRRGRRDRSRTSGVTGSLQVDWISRIS
jgi:hypothetical protein